MQITPKGRKRLKESASPNTMLVQQLSQTSLEEGQSHSQSQNQGLLGLFRGPR